jgi:tetratricopeptide (TPR) repeat protein
VNPARLSPKLRMDLCMQCHLEPTSTRFPALIRRFNRAPFSFTAGEPLGAFLLAFDHAPGTKHDDKFEIVGSSAYRLRQSRCFLESKNTLTCDTCHNPHQMLRGAEAARHYSAVCRQCHLAAFDLLVSGGRHPATTECATCHMPKRRTDDVVHVVMTDHLIQRRPPSRDLLAEFAERHPTETEEYQGKVVPYYPLPPSGADALYQALAQVMEKNNLREGVGELARLVDLRQPRETEWYFQLGAAWLASGEPVKAVAAYERAVRLRPQMVRMLQSLAQALKASGQMQRSRETLQQAIRIAPSDAGSWYQLGALASGLGQTGEAIESMQKAISLDPDLPGVHTTLAAIEAGAGQRDRAGTALREALRTDPYDAAAWDLAGRALAEQSQFPEAFYDFEKALRHRPNFGPYLYDYALTLASAGDFYRAEQSAESAVKADPTLSEPHALLGRILARKRQISEAVREYQQAIRLRPEFAQARLDLASLLVAQGEVRQAAEQLRKVASGKDAGAARVAADLLQRLGEY